MYVSSYNSYIPNISSSKTDSKEKKESKEIESSNSFSIEKGRRSSLDEKNLPVKQNYQTQYNYFRDRTSYKEFDTFDKIKKYNNAKEAYTENARLFSLTQKPKAVIGNITLPDRHLSKEVQETKAKLTKQKLINIYVENDNYYKVTAA